MNAASDAFLSIFGLKPQSCATCTHALPSACYPQVHCTVKDKRVNSYEKACKAFGEKGKA